jgi:hypothetical protein
LESSQHSEPLSPEGLATILDSAGFDHADNDVQRPRISGDQLERVAEAEAKE